MGAGILIEAFHSNKPGKGNRWLFDKCTGAGILIAAFHSNQAAFHSNHAR
jgi:hypothetical protein